MRPYESLSWREGECAVTFTVINQLRVHMVCIGLICTLLKG